MPGAAPAGSPPCRSAKLRSGTDKHKQINDEIKRLTAKSEELLERERDINARQVHGLVRSENVAELGKFLYLARDLNLNLKDDEGFTPLHHAAALGLRTTARLLVKTNACDYGALDNAGRTAADLAHEWSGDLALARWLNWLRLLQARGKLPRRNAATKVRGVRLKPK